MNKDFVDSLNYFRFSPWCDSRSRWQPLTQHRGIRSFWIVFYAICVHRKCLTCYSCCQRTKLSEGGTDYHLNLKCIFLPRFVGNGFHTRSAETHHSRNLHVVRVQTCPRLIIKSLLIASRKLTVYELLLESVFSNLSNKLPNLVAQAATLWTIQNVIMLNQAFIYLL